MFACVFHVETTLRQEAAWHQAHPIQETKPIRATVQPTAKMGMGT